MKNKYLIPRSLFNNSTIAKVEKPMVQNGGFLGKSFAISPRILRTSEKGKYEMYLTERGSDYGLSEKQWIITKRVSADGKIWGKGRLVLANSIYGNEKMLGAPDLAIADNGKIEMFYEAREESDPKCAEIHMAISLDYGESWKPEKLVIGSDKKTGFGTPSYIKSSRGNEYLFFHENSGDKYHIVSAKIDKTRDAKTLPEVKIKQEEQFEAEAIYAPHVFEYENGEFGMLYSAWGENGQENGRICLAESEDLEIWEKKKTLFQSSNKYDERHCSEPFLCKIGDQYKVFYEASNFKKEWRICCANIIKT